MRPHKAAADCTDTRLTARVGQMAHYTPVVVHTAAEEAGWDSPDEEEVVSVQGTAVGAARKAEPVLVLGIAAGVVHKAELVLVLGTAAGVGHDREAGPGEDTAQEGVVHTAAGTGRRELGREGLEETDTLDSHLAGPGHAAAEKGPFQYVPRVEGWD